MVCSKCNCAASFLKIQLSIVGSFTRVAVLFTNICTENLSACHSSIIGSSNMSRSALTSGVEWNVQINRAVSPELLDEAIDSFITAFYSDRSVAINLETIKQYDEKYHAFHRAHGTFIQEWTKQGEIELILPVEETVLPERVEKQLTYDLTIDPRPAQLEALEGLEATVAEKC